MITVITVRVWFKSPVGHNLPCWRWLFCLCQMQIAHNLAGMSICDLNNTVCAQNNWVFLCGFNNNINFLLKCWHCPCCKQSTFFVQDLQICSFSHFSASKFSYMKMCVHPNLLATFSKKNYDRLSTQCLNKK